MQRTLRGLVALSLVFVAVNAYARSSDGPHVRLPISLNI